MSLLAGVEQMKSRLGLIGICITGIALSVSACSGSPPSRVAATPSSSTSAATAPSAGATTTPPIPPTTALGSNLTGIGATLAAFKAVHPVDDGLPHVCSASDSCFGPELTNAEYGKTYQFINMLIAVGRITGYQQNFPPGTNVATAESEIIQLMPRDASMGAVSIDNNSGSCAMFDVTSPSLGSVFSNQAIGDPQGVVGVELTYINANGNLYYDPNNIQEANLSTQPVDPTGTC